MPFIADNIAFIVSSVLLAGLIAGASYLQTKAQTENAVSDNQQAVVSTQQTQHSQTGASQGTSDTNPAPAATPQTQTTPAPTPTVTRPSIRGGGEGGEREYREYDE